MHPNPKRERGILRDSVSLANVFRSCTYQARRADTSNASGLSHRIAVVNKQRPDDRMDSRFIGKLKQPWD